MTNTSWLGLSALWESSKPSFFRDGSSAAVGTYATIAMADPKAPFEIRVMGPALWTAQVSTVTTALYIVDPLQLRPGGLDDTWFSGWNPTYTWPSEISSEVSSWFPKRPQYWGDW